MQIKLTMDDYLAARECYTGFCVQCGASQEMCEPDARNYTCDDCGEPAVFGCEELLISGDLDIVGDDDAEDFADFD